MPNAFQGNDPDTRMENPARAVFSRRGPNVLPFASTSGFLIFTQDVFRRCGKARWRPPCEWIAAFRPKRIARNARAERQMILSGRDVTARVTKYEKHGLDLPWQKGARLG